MNLFFLIHPSAFILHPFEKWLYDGNVIRRGRYLTLPPRWK